MDKIFKDPLNVYGFENDILIVGYDADGRDCGRTLRQVMQICYQENSKLNKKQISLQMHVDSILLEVMIRRSATEHCKGANKMVMSPVRMYVYILILYSCYGQLRFSLYNGAVITRTEF